MDGVVNCASYAGGRRVADLPIADISEALKQPGQFIWVGLHEPDEALLRKVQGEFGLHDLAIEDALVAHQRPKVEQYGNHLFVVLRTAQRNKETGRVEFGETHLFVGPGFIVSVRHGPSLSYAEVRARCEATPHLLAKGPGFVLYAIMDFIVDQYFPIVEALEDDLEKVEESIFDETPNRETTERIYRLKRELLELKRAVSPLVDICNRLMRFDLDLIPEDTRHYIRDVYDHAVRINDMVDMLRELLTSALEANLSLVSVAQNDLLKKLAAWAVILAVPTMIAGVYGMNFEVMPELKWPFGYPGVMVVMAALCSLLYVRFKRSGWL
ncbi:MAG TPA: magnesium/cobalt transporter CorA [Candidatus Limnocylindrales bacterium]|nr:magnesium/cobalt transporter CorA [Candidatus Limnocylindrales bacterium]